MIKMHSTERIITGLDEKVAHLYTLTTKEGLVKVKQYEDELKAIREQYPELAIVYFKHYHEYREWIKELERRDKNV